MTPVAVEPYWDNATRWYMKANPVPWHQDALYDQYVLAFESWLAEQGVTLNRQLPNRSQDYHPWLYFADPAQATAFILRWS